MILHLYISDHLRRRESEMKNRQNEVNDQSKKRIIIR